MNDVGKPPEAADTAPVVRTQGIWSVLTTVMAPMFLAVVDQTIVAAALPAISASLGGVDRVSWIVIAYLVATTIAAPVYGQLRDVFGTRRMMLLALSVFLSASLICAFAPSMEVLVLGRVLQGLGGGGLMTLSQALIGEAIPPLERARYQGYLAGVMVTSSVFGPVAGGYLTEHAGWRSIFLVNLPIGALAMVLATRLSGERPKIEGWRLDVVGIGYFSVFIVSLLMAIEAMRVMTTGSALLAAGLAIVAAAFLVLLLRQQLQASFPLFRLDLLGRPAIWRSDAMAACHGAAIVSLVTYLPVYVHIRYGTSASSTGLMLLPLMIGIGTGSMLTGRLVARTGQTMIFPSVGLVVVLALLVVLAVWAGRLQPTPLLVLLTLLGLALGTVMGVVQLTVQRAAGRNLLGAAAASVQLSRSVGAAVGAALVGGALFGSLALADLRVLDLFMSAMRADVAVISNLPSAEMALVKAEIAHAFSVAFLTIAAFVAVAIGLAWSHPERNL